MHKTTGNWKLGLGLTLVATLLWGALPVILKLLLGAMDAYTITWYRFLAAAMVLAAFQARRRSLPRLGRLDRSQWLLLAVAVFALTGNYVLFVVGLDFITPGAAQVVIQLSPMLLLLGGLALFGERFGHWQWVGFGILGAGLVLFFNHRLELLFGALGQYSTGVLLIVAAAVAWAAYALAQKQLLKAMPSENILLLIYVAGALLFLPAADPAALWRLDGRGIGLLVLAILNTLFAYGAFAEALEHWEASRVSAVLTVTPLLTLGFMALLSPVSDLLEAEPLNALSIIGALMVVGGSMLTALTGRRALTPGSVKAGLE